MIRRILLAGVLASASITLLTVPAAHAVQGCELHLEYCNWEYYSSPAHTPPVVGDQTVLCRGQVTMSGHGTAYYIFTSHPC